MWTTTDGYVLRMPRSVLRRLAARAGVTEGEVMNEMKGLASSARRVGAFRGRKTGRTYPVFKTRSGPRSLGLVTRPMGGTRSWPGARGTSWPWAPTYAVVGVSSRFADPYDDDPIVPDDDPERLSAARPSPVSDGRVALVWHGPLGLTEAARLGGGGVYVVEDPHGQPVYVGQTSSFGRRLERLDVRFPRHRVRVARVQPPPVDVLGALGDAVSRAARGGAPRAPGGPVRDLLPRDHRYGALPPARPGTLRVERTVRTVTSLARQAPR